MFYLKYVLRIMTNSIFRYLPYFILGFICSFLFNSCDVNAENLFSSTQLNTNLYTTYGFEPVFNGAIYNWSSSGVGTALNLDTDTLVNGKLQSTQPLNFVNYGYGFRINTPTLLKNNYMYTYTALVCFDKSVTISDSNMFTSGSFNATTKNGRNVTRAANFSFYDMGVTDSQFDYCYFVYNTFTSFNNTFVLTQQIASSSGTRYGTLVGFKLEELTATDGLTSTEIQNIVDESNQQVKEEINQMNTNITNQGNQINNSIKDMNDSINNSNTDNDKVSNTISGVNVGNQGVITQLILMPVNLFSNILNAINGTCYEFNLGNLFGTDLKLPCINIESYVGSNLWNVIDILFSGFAIFAISKKIKQVFEQFTNLRDGDILND